MNITVTGRKMTISDNLRAYAEEKIGGATKIMEIDPLNVDIVLIKEQNPSNARRARCEVTIRAMGHIIRVEESEEDMFAAIDVAAAKAQRQMRKFKTRVIDKRIRASEDFAQNVNRTLKEEVLDLDKLMDDLSEDEDDEVVRVKEIEFEPLTLDEALVKIDLLGHDFFAYTDRDTNLTHILYRREDGGYGLLKQTD